MKFLRALFCSRSVAKLSQSVAKSDSLQPHGLQHTRLPCSSLSPGVSSNSRSVESIPSNYLILCRPLLLLPSVFLSIRVFSNESVLCIRWPKYWSFSFSISSSNEYSELISFRIDCLILSSRDLSSRLVLIFKRLSRVFFSTTVQKQQFFGAQPEYSPKKIFSWIFQS